MEFKRNNPNYKTITRRLIQQPVGADLIEDQVDSIELLTDEERLGLYI